MGRVLPPADSLLPFTPHPPELQGAPPTEKEALLRKLVALLEEEAEVINQKVTSLSVPSLSWDGDCGMAGHWDQNLNLHSH